MLMFLKNSRSLIPRLMGPLPRNISNVSSENLCLSHALSEESVDQLIEDSLDVAPTEATDSTTDKTANQNKDNVESAS